MARVLPCFGLGCPGPLAGMLFFGTYLPAMEMRRAKIKAAVLPSSRLSKVLTGRASTALFSLGFAIIAVSVLAWQAITVSAVELLGLVALCISAGFLSIKMQVWLSGHLLTPFARVMGTAYGYALSGFLFMFVLAWINWNYVLHPSTIHGDTLLEAIRRSVIELPERSGWIIEILSVFYALETAKIWCVVRLGASFWITVLYSLEAALVAFVVAKSVAAVTNIFFRIPDAAQQPSTVKPPKTAARAFWATIFVLACLTATVQLSIPPKDSEYQPEISDPLIVKILSEASERAYTTVEPNIDDILGDVYAPVYDAIDKYLDVHYSVPGEYTEYFLALNGDMAGKLKEILFADFDERLVKAGNVLDIQFGNAYEQHVAEEIEKETGMNVVGKLETINNAILQDTLDRTKTTVPTGSAAALAGGISTKKLSAAMAAKIGAKIATKAGSKWAIILAGGSSSALLCSPGGFLAFVCGAAGAIVVWLTVDWSIIKIDELLNREEFKEDLCAMINKDRADKEAVFRNSLKQKAENFSMRELARQASFGNP